MGHIYHIPIIISIMFYVSSALKDTHVDGIITEKCNSYGYVLQYTNPMSTMSMGRVGMMHFLSRQKFRVDFIEI